HGLDVVHAQVEVAGPVGDHLAEHVPVSGQPSLFEQVAAVAQGHGADVGSVADHLAAGRGTGLELPGQPAVGDVVSAVVARVVELVRLGEESRHPRLFHGFDVGEPGAGGELGPQVLDGRLGGSGLALDDPDVRV